ncbi:HNH endonuclease [Allocoleopsis sp.]|uniref:HNH endonuclease n=1 Tax=Allocoleopsis sp. TaxID=3088169 RepID=UPI002FD21C4B
MALNYGLLKLRRASFTSIADLKTRILEFIDYFNGEELHIHHRIPRSQGGKDTYKNLEYLYDLLPPANSQPDSQVIFGSRMR